ncbi:MAG: dCTP deaminase [Nanoarchaeota archaeon]
MIYSDNTIKEMIEEEILIIEPFDEKLIQPSSIDLRLGSEYMKVDGNCSIIEMDKEVPYVKQEREEMLIMPQQYMLATTKERIAVPNGVSAFVEGRSSIGRMGLFVQNAGWIDTGFDGQITLELFNANQNTAILLEEDRRICQIVLVEMDKPAKEPYNGKYQGQKGVWGSLISQDKEVESEKN